jgi:hypothetical protein
MVIKYFIWTKQGSAPRATGWAKNKPFCGSNPFAGFIPLYFFIVELYAMCCDSKTSDRWTTFEIYHQPHVKRVSQHNFSGCSVYRQRHYQPTTFQSNHFRDDLLTPRPITTPLPTPQIRGVVIAFSRIYKNPLPVSCHFPLFFYKINKYNWITRPSTPFGENRWDLGKVTDFQIWPIVLVGKELKTGVRRRSVGNYSILVRGFSFEVL